MNLVIVMIATLISRMQNAEENRRGSKNKSKCIRRDDDLRDVLLKHRAKIAVKIIPEMNLMSGSCVIE